MTARHQANPGTWCDGKCGEACRPHIVKQCPNCGGYYCCQCMPDHLCELRSWDEVQRRMPRYVNPPKDVYILGGQNQSNH